MPHAALWVVQQDGVLTFIKGERFQCRTRLCGGCNGHLCMYMTVPSGSFNAARGFVGGATCGDSFKELYPKIVSMPHAALWVVQREK